MFLASYYYASYSFPLNIMLLLKGKDNISLI